MNGINSQCLLRINYMLTTIPTKGKSLEGLLLGGHEEASDFSPQGTILNWGKGSKIINLGHWKLPKADNNFKRNYNWQTARSTEVCGWRVLPGASCPQAWWLKTSRGQIRFGTKNRSFFFSESCGFSWEWTGKPTAWQIGGFTFVNNLTEWFPKWEVLEVSNPENITSRSEEHNCFLFYFNSFKI